MNIFDCSFDDTNDVLQNWDTNIGLSTIDQTGTKSRTGIGCIKLNGQGPQKFFNPRAGLVAGVAYSAAGLNNMIIIFKSAGTFQARLQLNIDGSVSVLNNGLTPLGTSIPGLIQVGSYAYVEMKVTQFNTVTGEAFVRINGVDRLHVTNVNLNQAGTGTANTFEIQGPGGGTSCYVDDIYLNDLTPSGLGPPNDDFLGAVRLYCFTPDADGSPLQWTPSAGVTHFNLINEVPPDGDTSYIFDNTPGDIDQEQFAISGIPAPYQILAVQHSLCARIDAAGSRIIASCVDGAQVGAGGPLTTDYVNILTQMDYNPTTGLQWQPTDFPELNWDRSW